MEERDTLFQDRNNNSLTIFSIGHSNQSMEAFLSLLQQHQIQVLVDVRSSPYSRYVPHFNGTPLALAVRQVGIKYMFMGKELGGRPDGNEFYDVESHVLYNRVAEASFFLGGIKRLKEGGRTYRVAIMCSEEDPTVCHRHLLIGRVLAGQGVNLFHIRGDGQMETERELMAPPKEEILSYAQSLWGEQLPEQEENIWRSIRPVSQKKQPPSSSDL
jgi:uncharacterized protein (DUF488 family)